MAITPINLTRVSTNMQTLSLLDSLRRNTLGLFLEQNRLGSGLRLNAPSEDPVSAARAVQLSQVLERQDQILVNIRHANGFLAATDSGIGEVNDLLIDAHGIASEMVNSTVDQAMRDSSAELILGMVDQLVTVGNRQYQGVYLFGGQRVTTTPFTQNSGGVEYHGDTRSLNIRVDQQQDQAVNLTGDELFGALSSEVTGYVDLNPGINADTRLADLKGAAGRGVQPAYLRISLTSPGVGFTVDLRDADTVGDVVDMINEAAAQAGVTTGGGGQFNASINAAGNGIDLAIAAGTISVSELSNGTTARDLGLSANTVTGVAGGDLNVKVTSTTHLASLFGNTGAALGSIQITNGPHSATVDLSSALTVQDVLNQINSAGVEVVARINTAGTGIDVVSRASGFELRIGENAGTTASALGIRSMHAGTPLSRLNGGKGITTMEGKADLRITARDGSSVDVNLDGVKTVQDVLNAINTAAAGAGVLVLADLAGSGNGIRIVDATGGAGNLSVDKLNLSPAIDGLGLGGSVAANELVGQDTAGIKANSVFSALIDLYDALKRGDVQDITSAGERINGFIDSSNRLQGVIGARSKVMSTRLAFTEDAVVATQAMLSEVRDLDYTEAVTKFQQAQQTLEANLLTGSRLLQLSLLNYL